MPRRLLHKKPLAVMASGAVVIGSFSVAAWSAHQRTEKVDDLITRLDHLVYDQCTSNEVQDAVIVEQLEAARKRAIATLPNGILLRYQLQTIDDGIDALEPPNEADCPLPKGTEP